MKNPNNAVGLKGPGEFTVIEKDNGQVDSDLSFDVGHEMQVWISKAVN